MVIIVETMELTSMSTKKIYNDGDDIQWKRLTMEQYTKVVETIDDVGGDNGSGDD